MQREHTHILEARGCGNGLFIKACSIFARPTPQSAMSISYVSDSFSNCIFS